MKRALVAVAVAGVLVAGASSPAPAATKLERQVAALQRQVTSLRKQVTTLKRQVTVTSTCPNVQTLPAVCELALEAAVVAYCDAAITADAFQNTWTVINQVNGSPIFAAPVSLSDQNLCQGALSVPRQPTLVPPTIAPFQAMLGRLAGRPAPMLAPPPVFRPFWLWGT